MSRRQAAGDVAGMLALNSRGNIMVGAIVFPLFAFAFVFAEDLVTLVYTAAYLDAAPVMRIYIVGIAALVIELSGITMLLRQSVFVVAVNAVALPVAVALNWAGAVHIGLAGAAMGTVIVMYLDRAATLRRIARLTGVAILRLQDWTTLTLLALFAILAALLAWGVAGRYHAASGPLFAMLVGGATLACAYVAMVMLSGRGRIWLAAVRSQQQGL
jgi:O-antigen/teichoic acid export membrane protein